MNDISTILLVIGAAVLIYTAERQQEINTVAAILESKGIIVRTIEIKQRMNLSGSYRVSTILLTFCIVIFTLILVSNFDGNYWAKISSIVFLIGLCIAGCILRVMALLRIINESTTKPEKILDRN